MDRSSNSDLSRRAPRGLQALGALLLLAGSRAAHDHWIAPSSFHPLPGERLDLRLCIGHPSEFVEQPRDPSRSVRFELLGSHGSKPVVGLDGRSPAGFLRVAEAGTLVCVYQSNHAFVELEPAKYAEYLRVEGLTEVQAERERMHETGLPGRDSFLRCDKALLRVGEAPLALSERPLGLPIELSALSDLAPASAPRELVLLLEFEGKPLVRCQVKLMRLAAPFLIRLAVSDEQGHARFPGVDPGPWVASAVHQRRTRPEQDLPGDWEGFWASLAFELESDGR